MTRLRYILAIVVTLLLTLPAIDAQNFAPAAQAQVVVVKGNNVNLRQGPGLNYSVRGNVNKGTVLPYNYSVDGWFCVTYEAQNLYLRQDYGEYLDMGKSKPGTTQGEATATYVKVTGDGVRLRTGPGLEYEIKAKVNKNERLVYVSTHGEWFCVKYKGKELYISRDFAKIER